jgi:two-component system sensor histidine kinase PilS (NtrC family)
MDKGQSDSSFKQTFRGSRDALLQNTLDEPELGWRLLITLNAFRLLISTGLLLLFVIGSEPRFFGDAKPTLFAATAAGYLVFAILSAIALRQQWVPRKILASTQLVADVIAITLLMHASGGISSGLGGLLVIFIGAGSLVITVMASATLVSTAGETNS